jgi:hypothetical protein
MMPYRVDGFNSPIDFAFPTPETRGIDPRSGLVTGLEAPLLAK